MSDSVSKPDRRTFTVRPDATEVNTTHLLWDGDRGWIEAKAVYVHHPHPEIDGATSGPGWEFKTGADAARWLMS